ncbi:MAG: iron-containing alcohol dehydrogenase [Culicoidibacterales bacterium]
MENFIFSAPTQLIFGHDVVTQNLADALNQPAKVLVVFGGGSIKANGLYDEVIATLTAANIAYVPFGGIEPNPRVHTVEEAIAIARHENVDFVLAVGGGSVIDASKLIAAGICYNGPAWDLVIGAHPVQAAIPLGTILTLAATGSETNSGSVITNLATGEKKGWGSPLVLPKFALLDPKNTVTVPFNHTLYGIVDIMSHLFEQYFRENPLTTKNPYQEALIETTLRQVMTTAQPLLHHLADYDLRETMMICGTYALNGVLRIGSNGDWASHQIEHALSAVYDIPHGAGLAIVFPHWMHHVLTKSPTQTAPLLAQMATEVFGLPALADDIATAHSGINALTTFWQQLGAPTKLSNLGLTTSDIIDELVAKTLFGRETIGSFVPLNADDVSAILLALE